MATVSVSLPSDGSTADVSDYNTPITTIVNEINGNLDNANIKSNAAISGSKLADASVDLGAKASNFDGWVAVSDSWSYASATTITVPSDATAKYSVGDKLKLVQSGSTKYFYIRSISTTVLTVDGINSATVANSAISGIYYSKASTPLGFAMNAPIAFLARRTTDQTGVVSGTVTTLQAATEVFDYGSHYDNTTYTFTAPYVGVYHFEMTALIDAPGTLCSGYIAVNGTTVAKNDVTDTTAAQDRNAPTSITINLAANDTVTARVAHNAGANRTITGSVTGSSYFSGFMIFRTA